jgi:glucose/arabinose dehydrogenase
VTSACRGSVGPAALMVGAVRVLRRPEHHQDDELLLDAVEAMLDVGADEHHGSGLDGAVFAVDLDLPPAGGDVVDLVLGMGTLGIRGPGGQYVDADGQVMGPDELVVQAARGDLSAEEVGELVGVHGPEASTGQQAPGARVGTIRTRASYSQPMIDRSVRMLLAVGLAATLTIAACQSAGPTGAPSSTSGPAATATGAAPSPTEFIIPSIGPDRTVAPANPAPRLAHIGIALEPFANIPGAPIAMVAPRDQTGRMFVATQDGKIWVVGADGSVLPDPMLDISALITSGGEQGLLGLATHPSFPTDPRVFINYTNLEGDSIVASAALDPNDPNRLDESSLTKLLFVDQPYPNHNGGSVQFGPDGDLYLSFGDGGSGGDPRGYGQDRSVLLGKILRIDVDGAGAAGPYRIPSDNPYAGGGGQPEIWLWGLRNPWRMSFDRATGDLWIGDVGQGSYEEVDVAPQGTGNLNFGWNVMEGSHCFNHRTCEAEGLTFPVSEYGHDLGCTIIGGYVYRGKATPFLEGAYLFSDYCSGRIFALDAASTGLTPPVEVGQGPTGVMSAFGENVDGELFVTTLDGNLWRVVATEK